MAEKIAGRNEKPWSALKFSSTERGRGGGRFDMLPLVVLVAAVASLLALAVAGFGTRLGFWHFRTGFAVLRVAGYCGVAVALAGVFTLYHSTRKRDNLGILFSVLALICAAVVFVLPISWAIKAKRVPRIHDISTDLNNPPPFVAVAPLRPDRVAYGGAEVAAQQMQGYPELKTAVLNMPQEQAFARALETARGMGWQIVAEVPAEGRIEATATTFWFGFKDDISIRIVPAGTRSLLDVRSASRVGISDVGTNAERIREFLDRFNKPAAGG